MMIVNPEMLLQRSDYLNILVKMAAQADHERIITLTKRDYREIPPAHIAAQALNKGRV